MKFISLYVVLASFLFLFINCTHNQKDLNIRSMSRQELFELLNQKKYVKLDEYLSAYQKSYQAHRISDKAVSRMFNNFSSTDHTLGFHLNEWIKHMPDSYSAYLARGLHYKHLGWLARSTKYIKDTSKEQVSKMEKLFSLASKDLKKSLELNPHLTVSYESLIGISMALGSKEETGDILEQAIKFDSSSFIIRKRYLFSLQPKWGGSMEEMKSFVNESKKHFSVNPELKVLQGYIPYTLADMIKNKDREKAISYYDKAIQYGNDWWFYYERGRNHYFLNNYEKALTDLTKALSLKPQDTSILAFRFYVYKKLGLREEALADINKALQLDPIAPELLHARGDYYYQEEKYKEALVDFKATLGFGSSDPFYWSKLGRVYNDLRRYDMAIKNYKEALRLDPSRTVDWNNYSIALYNKGQKCQMLKPARKYIQLCKNKSSCNNKSVNWTKNTVDWICKKYTKCNACM